MKTQRRNVTFPAFLDFGFIASVQLAFYPKEAESKGALPHQVIL